jgi:hypothetical protein
LKYIRFKIVFIFSLLVFIACVEPLDLEIITTETILIIDGSIDDSSKDQFITVKKFIPSSTGNVRYANEVNAKVSVLKDGKEQIDCYYKDNGYYYLPLGFKALVGSKYKLKIILANGNVYESSEEVMRSTPEITGYTVKFDPKGIKLGENSIPAHLIYLDTKDPVELGDNFMWTWKLYEKHISSTI